MHLIFGPFFASKCGTFFLYVNNTSLFILVYIHKSYIYIICLCVIFARHLSFQELTHTNINIQLFFHSNGNSVPEITNASLVWILRSTSNMRVFDCSMANLQEHSNILNTSSYQLLRGFVVSLVTHFLPPNLAMRRESNGHGCPQIISDW